MGPSAINVADQQRDPGSLLNWMEQLIRRRRETPEIVFGTWSFVPVPEAAILALLYEWDLRTVLVIHNLGAKPIKVSFKLDTAANWDALIDLFGEGDFRLDKDGTIAVELKSYGCRWLRVRHASKSTPL